MDYFEGIEDLVELKMRLHHLCYQNHPDRHPEDEAAHWNAVTQEITAQYRTAFKRIHAARQQQQTAAGHPDEDDPATGFYWGETPDDFAAIVAACLGLVDVTLELCGSWLWIHGETYAAREILKAHGARWAPKKKCWYWRPPEAASVRHSPWTLSRIRDRYGSEILEQGKGKIIA